MEKYYIASVRADADGHYENCCGDKAQFWRVYTQKENGQSQCILDCHHRLSSATGVHAVGWGSGAEVCSSTAFSP